MASKFSQGDNCLFPTREIAVDFLDRMLAHKFFHRARKVPVTEAELRRGKKNASTIVTGAQAAAAATEKTDDEKKSDVKKRSVVAKDTDDAENSLTDGNKADKPAEKEKEKKKRKIRLDMHGDQVFVDGPEAYVWIYDPIPMHYWLFGALLVVGAIVVCLFPLWPPSIR